MAKPRVHELAKELGTTSKNVLEKLQEMGEFVRSASSTVEAPVVRKLKEAYGPAAGADAKAGGDKPAAQAAKPAAAKKPAAGAGAKPGP
ncbi:hypothetical protein GSY69_10420, partial [Brevibacterium sp. 5221]